MIPSQKVLGRACVTLALSLSLAVAATGCSSGTGSGDAAGKVTITVADLPTKQVDPGARAQFLTAVADFQKAHPDIDVKPSEYTWAADTFPARLASGQLETVFAVPFTEPQKLIAGGQVADISAEIAAVPDLTQLNPKLLAVGQAGGKTYGVPASGYAMGLMYNRALFKKAGLDPDKPPATWDELRADAKRIAALGKGVVGYSPITENNVGGWQLTMMNVSHGNDMETKGDNGKYRADFNSDQGVAALTVLKTMRWTDHSTGDKALLSIDDVQKLMASGRLGMMLSAGDWLQAIVKTDGGNRADFGMGPLPQAGGNTTLTGGSMEMVSPKASAAQRKAAVEWIDFQYLRTHSDPASVAKYYADQAKTPGAVIGFPEMPLFTPKIQASFEQARKPYVNLPEQNYAPYVQSLNTLDYEPEPPVDAQNVYKSLDGVVQQILSDSGADPKKALDTAASQVDTLLSNDQQ